MRIGELQSTDYRTDYTGYAASGNQRVNDFYDVLSPASEKSDSNGVGDVLGLTMIPYSDSMSYGMSAFYSDQSTEADPIIRVSSNYGGEQRYYDVHVNEVDPRNASQLEMFALSCYQDDKGITDGGTYGSFTRMKAYAQNAADNGQGIDLQNPDNASAKLDWISMLQGISNVYMQNSQTYSQYLDCIALASALGKRSDSVEDTSGTDSGKNNTWTVFHSMITEMAEKIKNGDTEPTYQIGGQSFTEEEWNKLIEKIDKHNEQIKAEQAERSETQKKHGTLTNEQEYKLFTDANERAFNSYGPNAPEEVKKAWMEASEETGTNGAGMAPNGMATHITAMSAERAVRWINGDSRYADILGDSVDSAIASAEKALYDLENPLPPINTRSSEIQEQREKEKVFYESFLDKLKQL